MFSESMDNRDDPFFTGNSLIELLYNRVIILKSLTNSHKFTFIWIDTGSLCLLFGFDVIERERIYDHISRHCIAEIIGTRIVIVFDFVFPQYFSIFLLIFLSIVWAQIEQLQNLSRLNFVYFMSCVSRMYSLFWR